MKANYRQYLAGITLLVLPLVAYAQSDGDLDRCHERPETHYRWDLVHIDFTPSPNFVVSPGGSDSALANDDQKLPSQGTAHLSEASLRR